MSAYEPSVKANDAYSMAFNAYQGSSGNQQVEVQAIMAMAQAAHALALAEHAAALRESQTK